MSDIDYLDQLKNKRAISSDEQRQLALITAVKDVVAAVKAQTGDITVKSDDSGVIAAIKHLESLFDDSKELQALDDIKRAIERIKLEPTDVSELLDAIKNIYIPEVDIPAVDFTPLQQTIKDHFPAPEVEDKRLDLSCYRAQDIREDGDKQYVGFLNMDGDWYIIENDITNNRLRYVFGSGKYDTAFKKAGTYEYKLLNEAINATP